MIPSLARWSLASLLIGLSPAAMAAPAATNAAKAGAAANPAAPAEGAVDAAALGRGLTAAFDAFLGEAEAVEVGAVGLPNSLSRAQGMLRMAGKSGLTDQLVAAANAAAAKSFPELTAQMKSALGGVAWNQATPQALAGAPDAATQYLRRATEAKLRASLLPVVQQSLQSVGGAQALQQMVAAAGPMAGGLAKNGLGNLESHVTNQTIAGLFNYLGRQEAALRANPALSKDALVQKAFAALGAKPAPASAAPTGAATGKKP